MNSKVVSGADQTLQICAKLSHRRRHGSTQGTYPPDSVSFAGRFSRSVIAARSPSGPRRVRISAFYAPPAETAAETLYEVLGIAEATASTAADIKRAYKQMARRYHPDVSPPERVDEYTRRFIMVHEAYETLSDPQRRAVYDRVLTGGYAFGKSRQGMEEKEEWKSRWESQLDALKRRGNKGNTSWGARMRSQTRP